MMNQVVQDILYCETSEIKEMPKDIESKYKRGFELLGIHVGIDFFDLPRLSKDVKISIGRKCVTLPSLIVTTHFYTTQVKV